MTNKMRSLNIFVVKSILEETKPTDINEEIRRNLLNELENYGVSKQVNATGDQNIQQMIS